MPEAFHAKAILLVWNLVELVWWKVTARSFCVPESRWELSEVHRRETASVKLDVTCLSHFQTVKVPEQLL